MHNLLLLLLFLLFAFKSDAQIEWVGQQFKTDVLIGKSRHNVGKQNIPLNAIDAKNPWGNFVIFNADGTFKAHNQVSCGLDCRIKITGTYTVENDKVEIKVNQIRYYDMCAMKPPERNNYSYGTFTISENDGKFVLKK